MNTIFKIIYLFLTNFLLLLEFDLFAKKKSFTIIPHRVKSIDLPHIFEEFVLLAEELFTEIIHYASIIGQPRCSEQFVKKDAVYSCF